MQIKGPRLLQSESNGNNYAYVHKFKIFFWRRTYYDMGIISYKIIQIYKVRKKNEKGLLRNLYISRINYLIIFIK